MEVVRLVTEGDIREEAILQGGKHQRESTSNAQSGLDLQCGSVGIENPQGCGKTQPAPGELRGEEGIEDPLQSPPVHAGSSVRDTQEHGAFRFRTVLREGFRMFHGGRLSTARLDPDTAPVIPDGIRRIGYEVHHDLPNFRSACAHEIQVTIETEIDLDPLRNGDHQQLGDLANQHRDIQILPIEVRLARIGEQLASEFAGPHRRGLHVR